LIMESVLSDWSQKIRASAASKRQFRLRGGGTKDFYGQALEGEVHDTRGYSGIVAYEPSELVITARCGTRLAEVETAIRERGQMLAFEPPHFAQFGSGATLGGVIAAGLSGPRRQAAGALRDFVLGVKIMDGRGEVLAFGGQVMKNVAGFDVSRLMAGSLGTLGIILEVSLKALPRPAVEAAQKKIGGELVEPAQGERFWTGIREQTDPFFRNGAPLWRISVPSTAPPLKLPGEPLIEWGGALRWLCSRADARTVRDAAKRARGHATLFRGGDKSVGVFQPLAPALMKIHKELKREFDP